MQNLELLLGQAHGSSVVAYLGGFEVEFERSEANWDRHLLLRAAKEPTASSWGKSYLTPRFQALTKSTKRLSRNDLETIAIFGRLGHRDRSFSSGAEPELLQWRSRHP